MSALTVSSQEQLEELLGQHSREERAQAYVQGVVLQNRRLHALVDGSAVRELQLQDVGGEEVLQVSHRGLRKLIVSQCRDARQVVLDCEGLTDLSLIGNQKLTSFWSQHKHLVLNSLELEMNPALQAVENVSAQLLFCQENDLIELKHVQDLVVNQQLVETLIYQHVAGRPHRVDFLDLIRLSGLASVRLTGALVTDFEGLQHLSRLEKLELSDSQVHLEGDTLPAQDARGVLRQAVFRNTEVNSLGFLLNPAFCSLRQMQLDFRGSVAHSPAPLAVLGTSLEKLVLNGDVPGGYVAQVKRIARLVNGARTLVVNQEVVGLEDPNADEPDLWALVDQLSQDELKASLYRRLAADRPRKPVAQPGAQEAEQELKTLREENAHLRMSLGQLQQQQGLFAYKQAFSEQAASPAAPPRSPQETPKGRPLSGVRVRRNTIAPMELGRK